MLTLRPFYDKFIIPERTGFICAVTFLSIPVALYALGIIAHVITCCVDGVENARRSRPNNDDALPHNNERTADGPSSGLNEPILQSGLSGSADLQT